MGVRINGVWHEELADPETGGTDEGAGRNFTSAEQYNQAAAGPSQQGGENLNWVASTSPTSSDPGNLAANQSQAAALAQYAASYEKMLKAVAERDDRAFAESLREFDLYFGLDQAKAAEDIRQFNETLGLNQAALTGVYQGQPTLQAQNQAANYLGTYQGQPTLQAQLQQAQLLGQYQGQDTLAKQQQQFQQALDAAGLTGQYQGAPTMQYQQQQYAQGTGLVNLISGLQANPWQQQAAMGQLQPLLAGRGVAGFANTTAVPGAGTGGLGYLQQMIDDIRSGGQANQASVQSTLDAIPTPAKLNSVEFFRSPQTTQNLVLQGMREKYGIDPNDALQQIKNTMPGFQAPSTYGQVRR